MDENKINKQAEKLTDKAFSRLMLTSVLSILVCIMCLCSATWAWFNASISSNSNTVGSGYFGLDVSFTDSSSVVTSVDKNADGTSTFTFAEAGTYTVKLVMTADTTVSKGFCTLKVDGVNHYTGVVEVDVSNPYIFNLEIKNANTTVVFYPAWGSPESVHVVDGTMTIE